LLDPNGLKLWKLEDGSLVMKHAVPQGAPGSPGASLSGGRKVLLGPPRRALPLSDPDRWIVFSDCDGVEVGILSAVDELEEGSQAILREALKAEYTLEHIVRIISVDREPLSGQTHWRVEIASAEEDAEPSGEASQDDGSSASTASSTASSAPSGLVSILKVGADDQSTSSAEPEAGEDAKGGTLGKMASLLNLGRDKDVVEAVSSVEREFTIAGQEDVQTARYPHIFIVDIDRRRYEIPNCEALDTESRKAAERFF
jgi:hypothetical protein